VLEHWKPFDQAPADVVLMMATLQQYLHDFDGSIALLERLVAREPTQAQAWLTLATVRRVQGNYAASDAACAALLKIGVAMYGQACRAENMALRGEFDAARRLFGELLAPRDLPLPDRSWLLTSLAELEWRAGRNAAAETAFRGALAASPDEYSRLAYADFLLASQRAGEVPPLLRDQVRSDPVLLRLAQAAVARQRPDGSAAELRSRIEQAALRPQAADTHAREQAMFALDVEADPQRALKLALANVELQREPIDLLLLARVARAARSDSALQQAARISKQIGLRDARLDALL
jgi:predicted Zn-dependent protease